MLLALLRQILINRSSQEENDNNRCGDPDRAVEIWVPLEHVEEVGAWVQGGGAAAQDFGGVDVEGLGVEV